MSNNDKEQVLFMTEEERQEVAKPVFIPPVELVVSDKPRTLRNDQLNKEHEL